MTMKNSLCVSLALCVACGGDESSGDEAGDGTTDASTTDAPTTDTDASSDGGDSTGEAIVPTVVETSPADGERGVPEDATITIQFSTAMDKAATQAAYQSASLPSGAVTFAWNDAGDVLTITPNDPLEYAVGGDPILLEPQTYDFTLTTAAQAEDGTTLAEDVLVSFSTLRRLEQVLEREVASSGNVDADGAVGSNFFGDRNTDEPVRWAVSFDLTQLAPDVAAVELALFRASWTMQSGNPWAGLGGGVVFQHVAFDALDDAFDAPVTGDAGGLFGGVGDVDVERDAAAPLTAALADPATYHDALQLRARWIFDTDDDGAYDSISLVPDDLELAVTYLAP